MNLHSRSLAERQREREAQTNVGPAICELVGHRLSDVERGLIIETLRHHDGNRVHAARTLGLSIRTIRNKINIYTRRGFDVPQNGGVV